MSGGSGPEGSWNPCPLIFQMNGISLKFKHFIFLSHLVFCVVSVCNMEFGSGIKVNLNGR